MNASKMLGKQKALTDAEKAKKCQVEPANHHFEQLGKDIRSRSSNEDTDTQHMRRLKWRWMIGLFNGVFPVQNVLHAKSEFDLVFKRRSLVYFSSWFIFVLKVLGFLHVSTVMAQPQAYYKYKLSFTDIIAIFLSLVTTYCFGISMHLLSVLNVSELLEFMVAVADYRRRYPAATARTGNAAAALSMRNQMLSAYVAFCPLYSIWRLSSVGLPGYGYGRMKFVLVWPGIGRINTTDHFWILFAYCAAILAYLELGVMTLFGQLSFASHSIVSLLNGIIAEVEQISQLKSKDATMCLPYRHRCQESSSPWSRLSLSYLEFMKVFEKFENCVSPKYLVLYLVLTTGTISGAYYLICSDDPTNSEIGVFYGLLCCISMYRVYDLGNTGESIMTQHGRLMRALANIGEQGNMGRAEKYDFTRFLTMVDSVPVILNTKGFFDVRRSNIPKIISLILTYIIVLLQFRMVDKIVVE